VQNRRAEVQLMPARQTRVAYTAVLRRLVQLQHTRPQTVRARNEEHVPGAHTGVLLAIPGWFMRRNSQYCFRPR